ncbi:hypothetical protein K2173_008050 [Erythroxylum novogranatense]|uniref:Ubiquitin-like protease family profile domain-containing protein n=1 Tax=Erythroxylum novogranatense TaxID=1862640 RepID=A0AAV8T743_9ROSI|nr:hypothetical protein K2173_008050 [Erythroxylum novogranatense]
MNNALGVFDFKKEDELTELAASKFLSKFKNPNLDGLEYEFAERGSHGPDVLRHDTGSFPCVDVDATECDRSCGNTNTDAHVLMMGEDFSSEEGNSGLDSTSLPNCLILKKKIHPNMEMPWKYELAGVLSDSPSSSKHVDEQSDAEGSMNENSPSSRTRCISEDVNVNSGATSHCSSGSETDVVNFVVDYVVYRHDSHSGCLVNFSSSGIKINGLTAHTDQDFFSIEIGIDDIIHVESYNLEKFETVIIKLRMLSKKDAIQDENAYGTSGVEELEFSVVEPNWIAMWEHLTSLNMKYFAVWRTVDEMDATSDGAADVLQQRPYFPHFDEAFEDVIYPQGDSDAVSISKRDVDLLQPETFINDTIIDFYIKYLKNQILAEDKNRFHFFNSFFFRKLADLDKDPSSASDGRAAFLRVHKWTRKMDLFGKDYVFIPVNFNLHWSLLVICHPGEVASFKDEEPGKSLRVPCILHMDSIKGTHAGLKTLVQSYLWEEWKERHKEMVEDFSSKFLNLRFVPLELPQQENMFDCGLFLLHYLELFLVDAPLNFNPFKINGFSKFLTVDWFPPSEASLKRTLIQRLISELLNNRFQDSECGNKLHSDFLKDDHKDTGVEFVSEGCNPALSCRIADSEPGQGIEITLLDKSTMRNSECVNDSGLVLREFFEPGVTAASLLAQCSSFDQSSSYYQLNCAVPQIEDGTEPEEQHLYYSSGDTDFNQITGAIPQSGSVPFSFRGFRDGPSWDSGISMQVEDDGSPSETSVSDSDDSEIGIIENGHMEGNMRSCQQNIDEQRYTSTENTNCLVDGLASTSNEMLDSYRTEVTEDAGSFPGTCEDHNLTSADAMAVLLHENENPIEEDGMHEELEGAEVTGDEVQTIGNEDMADSEDRQDVQTITNEEAEMEEQQAAKRRRVMPSFRDGDMISKDLHL